jgi:2-polyprenyl-6-methoxyphenol hydroxylase-like FAD-dependent oxidoreductase
MNGIVFLRLGYNVTILERTPASILKDQGAGISLYVVIPPVREALQKLGTSGSPMVDFLSQYDRTKTPTLSVNAVQYLNRDGSIRSNIEGRVTGQIASWDSLYNILRANFDGGYKAGYIEAAEKKEGEGDASYLSGFRVTNLLEVGNSVKLNMRVQMRKRVTWRRILLSVPTGRVLR